MSSQHSFYNRHQKQLRTGFEALIGALFLLIVSGVLLRVETTPSPIYASDEYAYLKHGLDLGKPPVGGPERDPGLVGLSNSIYLWIVRLAGRLTGDPTPTIRVVNFVCYFIGLPLLGGWLLLRRSDRSAVFRFIGLLAVLPSSVFVLSPMPEILFATLYTVIAVLMVMLISPAPSSAALLSGVAIGILVYIKPHAVAAMAGFTLFFMVHAIRDWHTRELPRRLLPVTFVAGVALGIFFVNATILKHASFAPKFVGNLYAATVQSAFSLTGFIQGAENIAGYALLHGLVLIVVFPLAFASCIHAVLRLTGRKKDISWTVFDDLALLTIFCAGAFIAMTADFTYFAGVRNEFESNRLHGRYLIVIFPSLLLITCHVLSVLGRQSEAPIGGYLRSRSMIGAFTFAAIGTAWLLCRVKLFPWDYPELFSLYSNPNGYWGWVAPISLRTPIFAIGFIVLVVCFIRPHQTPLLLGLGQAGFFAASLFLTTFWQETHARRNESLAEAGHILRSEVGPKAQDLLLVGSQRYGDVCYVLCGLLANPWIKIAAPDSELTPGLIPKGVRFVATLGSYAVKFPFVSYAEKGRLRIYGLKASTIRIDLVPAPLWNRAQFVAHLGGNQQDIALFGFNPPEPWGAWTANDDAVVLLPYRIYGSLYLKFQSWIAGEERGDVTLVLGESTLTFHATATPTEFHLPVLIGSPTDRIQLHFPAVRRNPWDEKTGVALSEIAISPEP
jgi:type IV secretory pathway TrbD component